MGAEIAVNALKLETCFWAPHPAKTTTAEAERKIDLMLFISSFIYKFKIFV
jgi:hypothetical protein